MITLYIDTTSNYLYSCLACDDRITGEIKLKLDKDLSVFTLQKITEMIENNNLKPTDIDKILVVNGPGSFTGIRIGVTIAKTYAWGLKKEISTISSLKAMALSSKKETVYKVPVIDARRGYIYGAIYDIDNHPILKDQYLKLDTLKCILENLPEKYSVITNQDINIDNLENYDPNFSEIIRKCRNCQSVNPHSVNPIYLKLTEAEENQVVDIL